MKPTIFYVAKVASADYNWNHLTVAIALELSRNLTMKSGKTNDLVEEGTESTWILTEFVYW